MSVPFFAKSLEFSRNKGQFSTKKLSSVVNHLTITTITKEATRNIPNVGKVNFREYFAPIEQDLRKLIKNRNKKFVKLRGVRSYERLHNYCSDIQEICAEQDPNHRVTKILMKTAIKLEKVLEEQASANATCLTLFSNFGQIQEVLSRKGSNPKDHKIILAKTFKKIWNSIRKNRQPLESIRATLPAKGQSLVFVKEQWYRLYKSYLPGLFNYYRFPIEERTNSKMEQQFGQEKQKFIQRSGKPNVSRQIRMRGATELKIQYAGNAEIKNYLDNLEGSYSRKDVLEGLLKLQEMQNKESNRWQSRIGGKNSLRDLFKPKN